MHFSEPLTAVHDDSPQLWYIYSHIERDYAGKGSRHTSFLHLVSRVQSISSMSFSCKVYRTRQFGISLSPNIPQFVTRQRLILYESISNYYPCAIQERSK